MPAASLIATVEPASALPVTVTPSSLTTTSVGAAGAVVSLATTVTEVEAFPAVSVEITLKVWPFVCAGLKVAVNEPSEPTVVLPIVVPSASLIVTFEPASALPVTVSPSPLTCTPVGAAGAVVSLATTVAGVEAFPAVSVEVTLKL